jgi:sialate O-acetylesterase
MAPTQTRVAATFFTRLFTLASNAFADVQLPGIISDHMRLQRDMPVRIFGKASPGESVTVTFRGQTVRR